MALYNWKIANLEESEGIKFRNQKLMVEEIHFSLDLTFLTVGSLQKWSCCHNLRIKYEFYCEVASFLLFVFVLYIYIYRLFIYMIYILKLWVVCFWSAFPKRTCQYYYKMNKILVGIEDTVLFQCYSLGFSLFYCFFSSIRLETLK